MFSIRALFGVKVAPRKLIVRTTLAWYWSGLKKLYWTSLTVRFERAFVLPVKFTGYKLLSTILAYTYIVLPLIKE